MKRLFLDIQHVWQQHWAFKLAAVYLLLLLVSILLLPCLPLPYSPNYLDLDYLYLPPFCNNEFANATHWLGTDALGRDVLTETLYGARTGLFISIPVVLASTLLGVFFGSWAGFFGDNRFKVSRISLLLLPLLLLLIYYMGAYLPLHILKYNLPLHDLWVSWTILGVVSVTLWWPIRFALKQIPWLNYHITFPVDRWIMRLIEVVSSVPWLILVLLLASFMPPSVMLLCLILTLTSWTQTARLARAEMLRVREMPYIEASRALGLTNGQLIFKQALPNIVGPVIVALSFGITGMLILESTLSFLGVGLPPTVVSWGRTITGIRANTSAWWLVAFPGGLLGLTVVALQTLSYYLLKIIRKS